MPISLDVYLFICKRWGRIGKSKKLQRDQWKLCDSKQLCISGLQHILVHLMWFTQAVVSAWNKGSLSSKQDYHLIFKHSNTYFAVLLLAFCLLKSMLFSDQIRYFLHTEFSEGRKIAHVLCHVAFIFYVSHLFGMTDWESNWKIVTSVLYPPNSSDIGDETRGREKNKEGRRGEENLSQVSNHHNQNEKP